MATELVELQNLTTVATQILKAALTRKESRGGHFNLDYPPKLPQPAVLHPSGKAEQPQHRRKAASRQPFRDNEIGGLVRGGSPPRQRPKKREIALRSQAKDQQVG